MKLSDVRIVSLLEGFAAQTASYAFWSMGSEPLAPSLPTPQDAEICIGYVAHLSAVCDVLVLPLGLVGGVSLFIAREAHRSRAPFRMVLFTGSRTATSQMTAPLFDYCLSSYSMELYGIRLIGPGVPPTEHTRSNQADPV